MASKYDKTIGDLKEDMDKAIEAYIEADVDRRMGNLYSHVLIDGKLVDSDICDVTGGEVYVEIKTPICFSETKEERVVGKCSNCFSENVLLEGIMCEKCMPF